jgi:hypothetical protein
MGISLPSGKAPMFPRRSQRLSNDLGADKKTRRGEQKKMLSE